MEDDDLDGDVVSKIKLLKAQDGPELQVHGSGNLIQTLLQHDLVDEFWLKTFPVALGTGKRLFAEGTMPAGFKLLQSRTSPAGVVVASYARGGAVKVMRQSARALLRSSLADLDAGHN